MKLLGALTIGLLLTGTANARTYDNKDRGAVLAKSDSYNGVDEIKIVKNEDRENTCYVVYRTHSLASGQLLEVSTPSISCVKK